jgi:hypothetical protein
MKGWDGPVAGEQTAWADGCPLLDATSSVLTAAQLIHPPTFSYFEAMSAVQLMDPQMDAGLSHGDDSGATVEELVVTGRAPLALSPRALLSVLGRLTACEVRAAGSWCGDASRVLQRHALVHPRSLPDATTTEIRST